MLQMNKSNQFKRAFSTDGTPLQLSPTVGYWERRLTQGLSLRLGPRLGLMLLAIGIAATTPWARAEEFLPAGQADAATDTKIAARDEPSQDEPSQDAAAARDLSMKQQRQAAAQRRRRIIFNNDGNGWVARECQEATPAAFLKSRMTRLAGTNVDTVFYCTTEGFNLYTHDSKVSEVYPPAGQQGMAGTEVVQELIRQGTDTLRLATGFCRQHDIEVFWSMRINDEHDQWHAESFSQWKKDHPECLFGTVDRPPPHGPWTGVDYAHPAVRDQVFRIVQDVCLRYDLDGVEFDFFRQLTCFKSVAWGKPAGPQEWDSMTDLLRRVRKLVDEIGRQRGRPLLVAVRVPDSVEYCRALGLDLVGWLEEDLIDLMVVGGYFWLQPWETSVQLGHKYGVPVYPSLDGSRVADPLLHRGGEWAKRGMAIRKVRRSNEAYRAHAMNVWNSGADGVYLFNFNYYMKPHEDYQLSESLWNDLGDPQALSAADKIYHVSVMGHGHPPLTNYLPSGAPLLRVPTLCPDQPVTLSAGKSHATTITLGDDLRSAVDKGWQPHVKLNVKVEQPVDLAVTLNGRELEPSALSWKSAVPDYRHWQEYDVHPKAVQQGTNALRLTLPAAGTPTCTVYDVHLRISYAAGP